MYYSLSWQLLSLLYFNVQEPVCVGGNCSTGRTRVLFILVNTTDRSKSVWSSSENIPLHFLIMQVKSAIVTTHMNTHTTFVIAEYNR